MSGKVKMKALKAVEGSERDLGGQSDPKSTGSSRKASGTGRDEMNLAEFPLACLSDRPPNGLKTLEFSDTIFDRGRREQVTRKLTITASDKFGLPTAFDDEVILALVQLTAQKGFSDRKVLFSRYEIIKQLGWKDSAWNYKRLEVSLKRWLGVTLYYDRAWWSREEACWVNKSFHILSDLELLDQTSRQRRLKAGGGDAKAGLSSFTWNEAVFHSFQAGYLKPIDMTVFRALKTPTAKRMYRFLDKRFHHKATLKFELRNFAVQHIGLSGSYHTGGLKRKLRRAIAELEAIGFLVSIPESRRYTKEGKQWFVHFNRKASKPKQAQLELMTDPKALAELLDRGITRNQAIKIATETDSKLIHSYIEYHDHLVKTGNRKVSENPAGYLYRAITEQYAIPKTFETSDMRVAREERVRSSKRTAELERKRHKAKELADARQEQERIERAWASLSKEEQATAKGEACAAASKLLGRPTSEGPIVETFLNRTLLKKVGS